MEIIIVKRVRSFDVSTATDALQFALNIIKECGDWQCHHFISRFEDTRPAARAIEELMEYSEKHGVVSITVATTCSPFMFNEDMTWSEKLDFCGMLLANSDTAWDKTLVDNATSRIAELSFAMR